MKKSELLIRETIDGVPKEEYRDDDSSPKPSKKDKKSGGKTKSTSKAANHPDKYIWGIYLFLIVVSIIEVYSAISTEIESADVFSPLWEHVRFLIVGVGVTLACQQLHYKFYRWLAFPTAVLCLALVVYAAHFGVRINDAMRSIPIGGMTIQPAEMLKLALVMVLARIMAKNQIAGGVSTRGVILSGIVVAVMCISVVQNGFTNMALMMVVSLSMFIIGGTQKKKICAVVVTYVVLGGGGYMLYSTKKSDNAFALAQAMQQTSEETGYEGYNFQPAAKETNIDRTDMRKKRIKDWLRGVHPGDTVTDENYQVKHAKYAMAHGGKLGNMPGNSRESARLPLAYSDYIFSIIVEDWGLWGGLLVLVVYMLLIARAGVVASKCSRAFPALLIMGCAVMVTAQALVHMGIVTGVMPVSGQPLPLVSKGGTSILIMSAAFGMMLSVSRFAVRSSDNKAIRAEIRDLPTDLQSENPLRLQSDKK